MLEELDRHDTVKAVGVELVRGHIAGDARQVRQRGRVGLGLRVDVRFLGFAVGEGGYLGIGKALREVDTERAPATAVI